MWKWLLLLCWVACSGCISIASDAYQPGIRGVRDLPQADYYNSHYGWVCNSTGMVQ